MNDLVVLDREDRDSIEIGIVKMILVRNGSIHLVVKPCVVTCSRIGIFEHKGALNPLHLVNIVLLHDFYPLHLKGNEQHWRSGLLGPLLKA